MKSALVSQIVIQIAGYVQSRSTLRKFRDWFAPVAWDIESTEDSPAIDLAYRIDGILMESTSGNWSEADLKKELASAIRPFETSSVQYSYAGSMRAFQIPEANSSYSFTRAEA